MGVIVLYAGFALRFTYVVFYSIFHSFLNLHAITGVTSPSALTSPPSTSTFVSLVLILSLFPLSLMTYCCSHVSLWKCRPIIFLLPHFCGVASWTSLSRAHPLTTAMYKISSVSDFPCGQRCFPLRSTPLCLASVHPCRKLFPAALQRSSVHSFSALLWVSKHATYTPSPNMSLHWSLPLTSDFIFSVIGGYWKFHPALQPPSHCLGKSRDLCEHLSMHILSLQILGSFESMVPQEPSSVRNTWLGFCLNILECSLTKLDGRCQFLIVTSWCN